MSRITPDPTFYATAREAAAAQPEKLGYLVTLNPGAATGTDGDGRPDFGWNACSSALCPWAPPPHLERRYLLIPGLRSSRLHIVDVKADPRNPTLAKVIEPEEIARKTGYSRPHTSHCGPDGIYMD